MKTDKTTYKDKEENQIGLTAYHTSQPDKVLFFAYPHFLFLKSITQMAHCLLPDTQANASQNQKSAISAIAPLSIKRTLTSNKNLICS